MSKHGVFSGPYFPAFELNTEIYGVNLRIQSKCRKIWAGKNSVFAQFLHSEKEYQNAATKFLSEYFWMSKTIHSQCTLSLTPENIRQPYGFLMFSAVSERVHWDRMG